MPIEAIGRNLELSSVDQNSAITQEEFVRLFLTQLTYQDPLEPLDNSEFIAQLAQFSSVEQQRQNGLQLENIAEINSIFQASTLVGKEVEIGTNDGGSFGTVTAVSFDPTGVSLTIQQADGDFVLGVRMSQIQVLR